MKAKTIRKIFSLIAAAGVLLMLGTVGAADMGGLTVSAIWWRSVIGLAMVLVGGTVGGVIDWRRG